MSERINDDVVGCWMREWHSMIASHDDVLVFSYSYTGALLHQSKKTDIIHHLYKSWGKQKWHWPFINISSAKYFTTQNINIFSLEGETQQILPNPNEEYQTCTKMKIQQAHVIFCLHCNHRRMTMKHKYKIEMGCSCLRQDPSEESIFDHRYLAQT